MRSQNTALVALNDFDRIPELLHHCGSELGGTMSAFEVMWSDFYTTIIGASDRHTPPLPADYAFYILIEATGGDQSGDEARFLATLESALEQGFVDDAAIAGSGAQRAAFWEIRDDITNLARALNPPVAFDISLPIANANDYVNAVRSRLQARWPETCRCTTFGHLGDSNIHFVMTIGNHEPDQLNEAMTIVYEELRPFGGSVSAEHGIGLEKRAFLGYTRSDVELQLMRTLKAALDPAGILNPGKVLN
jgi:FAD/FMN-containing dehydrogenase